MNCCNKILNSSINTFFTTSQDELCMPVGFEIKYNNASRKLENVTPSIFNLLGSTSSVIWLTVAKIKTHPFIPYIALAGMITGLVRVVICSWAFYNEKTNVPEPNTYNLQTYKLQIIRGITEMAGLGAICLVADTVLCIYVKISERLL